MKFAQTKNSRVQKLLCSYRTSSPPKTFKNLNLMQGQLDFITKSHPQKHAPAEILVNFSKFQNHTMTFTGNTNRHIVPATFNLKKFHLYRESENEITHNNQETDKISKNLYEEEALNHISCS